MHENTPSLVKKLKTVIDTALSFNRLSPRFSVLASVLRTAHAHAQHNRRAPLQDSTVDAIKMAGTFTFGGGALLLAAFGPVSPFVLLAAAIAVPLTMGWQAIVEKRHAKDKKDFETNIAPFRRIEEEAAIGIANILEQDHKIAYIQNYNFGSALRYRPDLAETFKNAASRQGGQDARIDALIFLSQLKKKNS